MFKDSKQKVQNQLATRIFEQPKLHLKSSCNEIIEKYELKCQFHLEKINFSPHIFYYDALERSHT